MNKPKLVSSPTIKRVKDRQFYEMIIKDAKRILPMVNDQNGLCALCAKTNSKYLHKVIDRFLLNSDHTTADLLFFSLKKRKHWGDYILTPAWKSDRIFLLKEIIKYCEYKLGKS